MIGPNNRPTTAVPYCWITKSIVSTVSEIGTTRSPRPGDTTFRPSTADMTEMAGVMMPSP